MTLTLYNTLTRRKEPFQPIDPKNVRMYVCGPTVYDLAHIGNARPIIVFDVLFRLLRHIYGEKHVTYARNITDVDDKINARAVERYPDMPPTEAIRKLTEETTAQFHKDIAALGVLEPTVEPRATEHIAEMRQLCEALVKNGHAYVAEDHVLFAVNSMADYGKLARRSLEEMEAGARVDVAPYKKGPMDFVLWKPSKPGEPAWPSPCGIATPGRPGWHIECSAMADRWLWQEPKLKGLLSEAGLKQPHVFDIHGGGIDLVFPHHENEVAQSRCAHGTDAMANVWMHNGFLQVEGEKMSKSLGNFVTIEDALDQFPTDLRWGEVIRLNMLKTHYRQPLDWTQSGMAETLATYSEFRQVVIKADRDKAVISRELIEALGDDLNTPAALTVLHRLAKNARTDTDAENELVGSLLFLGFDRAVDHVKAGDDVRQDVESAFQEVSARELGLDLSLINSLKDARLAARKAKDWKESDRIRDELAAMGIQLKDGKDPQTGEAITTWEVKR